MQHLTGFAPLAERYQGFVIDLWGVIHDGVTPYAGAIGCLSNLARMGKPCVLLSNAPRRSAVAQAAMREMGIPDALHRAVITSGEVTHMLLRDRTDHFFANLGSRVFHLGPERDRSIIDGLSLTIAATPDEADFVLNSGPDDHRGPTDPAAYDPVLDACRAANLPMICANPDLEVIRGGVRVICAGLLAQRYEAEGGTVRWIGKPDPAVYRPALERLGFPAASVLGVGDALRTDIAGARAAGMDSAWVLGGIHAAELAGDPQRAEQEAARAGLSPIAALPAFVW